VTIARFALDTNIFLQCRDLPELPWSDVTDAAEIELYPTHTVLMEIERLKNDGNERRSDRARKTSARLRDLASSADRRLILREKGPRLLLLLPPMLAEEDEQRVLSHPLHDYRIVEETRLIVDTLSDVRLLTADIGPRLRAEQRGVPVAHVGENWLLPREASAIEKRVSKLERALTERGAPLLVASLSAPDHPDFKFERTQYGEVPQKLVNELSELFTRNAIAEAEAEVDRVVRGFMFPNTLQRPEDYLADVRDWREAVREAISHLPVHAHIASRLNQFTLRIANEGAGPAEHVKVTITGRTNVILAGASASALYWNADDRYLADARRGPPHLALPDLPEAGPMANVPTLADMLARPQPRDRYTFCRTSEDDGDQADMIIFECEDFRQGEETELHFAAFVGGAQPIGAISVAITAFNLTAPVAVHVETLSSEVSGNMEEPVVAMARLRASGVELNKERRSRA
jgi:hypothetical protein